MEEKKEIKTNLSTILLFLAIIAIIIMGYFIYKLNNDKNLEINKVSDLQLQVNQLNSTLSSLQTLIEDNKTTKSVEDNKLNQDNTSKYQELTEDIASNLKRTTGDISQKDGDQYFVAQEIVNNNDGTYTIRGRIYEYIYLSNTALSEEQYQELLVSKKIVLFDNEYTLGEFYDYYPGYGLKDANGVGFAVSSNSNHILFQHNDEGFYKGTDKYYEVKVDDNVEIELVDFEPKSSIKEYKTEDLEYINNGEIYDFIFSNEKVSKINSYR